MKDKLKSTKKKWTTERLKDGIKKYHKIYGHYPTSFEIDKFEFLPSSRLIQRNFGGLVKLRESMKGNDSVDFRKGEHRSSRIKNINKRASDIEKEVHRYLVNTLRAESVHRKYYFTDDRRTCTDFFVNYRNINFSVDIFFADNKHNFIVCLNNKIKKYDNIDMVQYPVIFLNMNDKITYEDILIILKNKKNKLKKNQTVMDFARFKTFCSSKQKQHKSR